MPRKPGRGRRFGGHRVIVLERQAALIGDHLGAGSDDNETGPESSGLAITTHDEGESVVRWQASTPCHRGTQWRC
jgi:hypothetical protein